jgi:hypothetical protein
VNCLTISIAVQSEERHHPRAAQNADAGINYLRTTPTCCTRSATICSVAVRPHACDCDRLRTGGDQGLYPGQPWKITNFPSKEGLDARRLRTRGQKVLAAQARIDELDAQESLASSTSSAFRGEAKEQKAIIAR